MSPSSTSRGLSATNPIYDYLPTFTSQRVYWVLEISAEIYRMSVINLRLCSSDKLGSEKVRAEKLDIPAYDILEDPRRLTEIAYDLLDSTEPFSI